MCLTLDWREPFVLHNDGVGSFRATSFTPAVFYRHGVAALGDLDEDGDIDAVVTTETGLDILTNDGSGSFPTSASLRIASPGQGTYEWVSNMALGDVDADDDLDVFVGLSGQGWQNGVAIPNRPYVLENSGGGRWRAGSPSAPPGTLADFSKLNLGDVNGDGALDAVTTGQQPVWFNILRPGTPTPISGAVNVPLTEPISFAFDRTVDQETFGFHVSPDPGGWTIEWIGGGGSSRSAAPGSPDPTTASHVANARSKPPNASCALQGPGSTVVLRHRPFDPGVRYTATITRADDATGATLPGVPYSWDFTTVGGGAFLPVVQLRALVPAEDVSRQP